MAAPSSRRPALHRQTRYRNETRRRHRLPRVKSPPQPEKKSKVEKFLSHIPCGMTIGMIVTGVGYSVYQLAKCCFVGDSDNEQKETQRKNTPLAQPRSSRMKKRVTFADELREDEAHPQPPAASGSNDSRSIFEPRADGPHAL